MNTSSFTRELGLRSVVLFALLWPLSTWPTSSAEAEVSAAAFYTAAEEAKKLVIRISGNGVEGAGIAVHIDDEYLYGVTAFHVIKQRGKILNDLKARLRFWPKSWPLEVLRGDPRLDLAAFRIAYKGSGSSQADLLAALPFARMGDSRALTGESRVHTIGHGTAGGWIDSDPARLASHDVSGTRSADTLRLLENCRGGRSGGGVFDAEWRLVAVTTDYQEPFCHALRIETVLAALADWDLQYRLEPMIVEGEVPPPKDGQIVVAVVDFDNRSGTRMPDIGPAGRDITTSFLFNLPGIRLVTRDRLDSVQRELSLNPTEGSVQGISRIGKLLDVDALVTGSVNRYEVERRNFKGYGTSAAVDSYHMSINLQIIDIETALVRFSRNYEVETKKTYSQSSSAPRSPLKLESELLKRILMEQVQADVQLALREVSAGTTAPIGVRIITSPPGADVVVGDIFEGQTPITLSLSIGLHEIEVRKAGYRLWRRTVRVETDMRPLEIRLER